jgi:hypothetical protein
MSVALGILFFRAEYSIVWYKLAKEENLMYLPDSKNGGYIKLPASYLRFGDIPLNENQEFSNSHNHLDGISEKGVSVYQAWLDPRTNKYVLESGSEQMIMSQEAIVEGNRPLYLVTGNRTGHAGADGEWLLDPKSIKVIRKIPYNQVVTDQVTDTHIDGSDIEDEDQYPDWNRDDNLPFELQRAS